MVLAVNTATGCGFTPQYAPIEQLYLDYHDKGLEILDKTPTEFYCNCSKERVAMAIMSVGKDEIDQMIEEGNPIEVKCHFCNTAYNFSIDDLKHLRELCEKRR